MRMRTRRTTVTVWSVSVLLCVAPLVAHHSFVSAFDIEKSIHIEGKVTQVKWTNPHASMDVAIPNNNGATASWHVELPSTNDLLRGGMTLASIPVGSDVVVDGYLAKSGAQVIGAAAITQKATGFRLAIPVERSWTSDRHGESFYDGNPVQLTGKVMNVEWVNPIPTVRIAVASVGGPAQEWVVETPPTTTLDQVGWNATSVVSGDVVQVGGRAARSGSKRVFATKVVLVEKGGSPLPLPRALLNSTPLIK